MYLNPTPTAAALDAEVERVRAFHDEQHRTFNWLDCRQKPCLELQARLWRGISPSVPEPATPSEKIR
jgi:hypothetical protein